MVIKRFLKTIFLRASTISSVVDLLERPDRGSSLASSLTYNYLDKVSGRISVEENFGDRETYIFALL